MEALQQYWMVLFLLAAGHGLFLFILLVRAARTQKFLSPLSILVLLFSISLIYYVGFWTGVTPTISPFWGLILTLPTLFGPLIYGYTQLLKRLPFPWHLHAIPFALHFLYVCLFHLQAPADGSWPGFNTTGLGIGVIGQNISLLVYSLLAVKQSHPKSVQRWVTLSFLGFSCSLSLYYVLVNTIDFKPQHDYFVSLFMSVFMFTVGYLSLQTTPATKAKLKSPRLSPNLTAVYRKQLLEYMQSERPYLRGDLKMKQVADHLGITVHHLSELINTEMGVNFAEFINGYRIQAAIPLLDTDQGIMEIGYRVGFNNKTSFSQTFKKQVGCTPTQFRIRNSASLVR